MRSLIKGIEIAAVAAAVPMTWLSLEEQFGKDEAAAKNVKKFSKSTGVKGRYLCGPRQTTADLCCAAAEKILSEKNIDRDKIGIVVLVTQTEDYRSPASATVLQYRLGIGRSCIAFDVNLGCSGFTSGLNIAGSLLMQSDAEYALLMCGDTSAREKDPSNAMFSSNLEKMLFGDSGTATLLHKNSSAEDMLMLSETDGSRFRTILVPYEWYRNPKMGDEVIMMDGVEVFNFSTEKAPEMIRQVMAEMNTRPEDYDCLVLHQANKMIIDRIAKLTGFDDNKTLRSIDTFGNTSSGSIPDTLVNSFGSAEGGTLRCIMCGYGVGLSWSAVDCRIDENNILELVRTDEYFDDGLHID